MKLKITDMNSHRRATRDLLLEYDSDIMPPHPRVAGLNYIYDWSNSNEAPDDTYGAPPLPSTTSMPLVYPWEQTSLGILSHQLYTIAANNGFTGTPQQFNTYFGKYLEYGDKEIFFDDYSNFPSVGSTNVLYFDLDEKILYYWDGEYLPANTMLITDTILNVGEA